VDMKIDAAPGEILRKRCCDSDSIAGCWRVGRSRRGRRCGLGIRLRRRGGAVAAPACCRNRESPSGAATVQHRRDLGSPLLPILWIV